MAQFSIFLILIFGNLQLICTVTPASSSMEETHNTLKFASRAKRVEIFASRNKVCLPYIIQHIFFFDSTEDKTQINRKDATLSKKKLLRDKPWQSHTPAILF